MKNFFLILILCTSVVACVSDTEISDESADVVSGPDAGLANVGGGGECGLDPVEQERNCPGGGGSSGGTCDRIGQACPPPPGSPHDRVCSYEQGSNGCVCRCFVPGGPALTVEEDPQVSELDQ